MKANAPLYPIREVSRLTGVNAITLRAWERRYGLIEPVRTDSGHRLYTHAHIERIHAAVKLTEQGVPISRVKALLDESVALQVAPQAAEDYDYPALLLQKVHQYDLQGVQQALDLLFVDLPEAHALQVLGLITHELSGEAAALQTFWNTLLLPRLYTRLNFMTRRLPLNHADRLWVQPGGPNTQPVSVLLVATWLAANGTYPLLQASYTHSPPDLPVLQKMHCEGVAVVEDSGGFDEQAWWVWLEQHPTLAFHYFVCDEQSTLLGQRVQAHYHGLETLFSGH